MKGVREGKDVDIWKKEYSEQRGTKWEVVNWQPH
jgi:hypothetical protein